MDRRKVLGYLSALGVAGVLGTRLLTPHEKGAAKTPLIISNTDISVETVILKVPDLKIQDKEKQQPKQALSTNQSQQSDSAVVDYLYKIQNFESDFTSDVYLDEKSFFTLKRLSRRLNRAQTVIGYMNYSILDFQLLIRYSKNYPAIGKFTDSELELIEELVTRSADDYGFFGDKLITNMNDKISSKHLSKISNSGQYLYKGRAHKLFKRIQDDVGKQVILTSGVRGLMKQMQLFTAKAVKTSGNLSRASRSLAPPGHSYHGIGDFDIGDVSLGKLNFTERFSDTDIYKKLIDLGYIKIRYRTDNQFGVRYEPWHIKVS